jgi:peptidoglycan/LPS O-acetylase OafA/YrhL
MACSPQDAEFAEKGLRDLEALLEMPIIGKRAQASQRLAETACSKILRPSFRGDDRSEAKQPLRRTAYLDGLRGFAALMVYSLHHETWVHSGQDGTFPLENVFGWDNKYYFICFPGIRIFFAGGHTAVAIFFVISGYVLSAKPLSLIHAQDTVQLANNLGSALFRRWLRLFIPLICVTFTWMTCWHVLGINSSSGFTARPTKTWVEDVWRWYCDFKNFSFIFTGDASNAYNDHTWSIPAEFRGSIVVYTTLLACSRCKTYARISCEVGLVFYFLYIVDGWFCALFIVGMLICDLELLAESDQLPRIFSHVKPTQNWIYYVLILISLYLDAVPAITDDLGHLRESPGWYLLSFLKPQAVYDFRWFFRFWAATLAMISIPRIPWLRRLFEAPFCQYLGRVSYGLYLVHGPVLWTLGDRLYAASGAIRQSHIADVPGWINLFPLPSWGPYGLELNYLIPHLVLLPFTLWLAEVITRLVDEPSVKVSQWLYKRLMVDADETPHKRLR